MRKYTLVHKCTHLLFTIYAFRVLLMSKSKIYIIIFLSLAIHTSKWRKELEGQSIIVKVILPS